MLGYRNGTLIRLKWVKDSPAEGIAKLCMDFIGASNRGSVYKKLFLKLYK